MNTTTVKPQINEEEMLQLRHYNKVFIAAAYVIRNYGAKILQLSGKVIHPDDKSSIKNIVDRTSLFVKSNAKALSKSLLNENGKSKFTDKEIMEMLTDEFRFPLSVFALSNTASFSTPEKMVELFDKIKILINEHNELERLPESEAP
jgi:hypothetical protein